MQDIYTYIPETNYVPREYSVAAILLLLFMVLIILASVIIIIIIIFIIIAVCFILFSLYRLSLFAAYFILLRFFVLRCDFVSAHQS